MLIPVGLHHILNSYVWFLYGDYQTPDGKSSPVSSPGSPRATRRAGILTSGFYPILMFGLPGRRAGDDPRGEQEAEEGGARHPVGGGG